MSVQTKIVLLLLAIVATLIGGLTALKISRNANSKPSPTRAARKRSRNFDELLNERGDYLKVVVDDTSIWNDMVLAIGKGDTAWAEKNVSDETLATYRANAIWIYKPDRSLFYSRNNRYAENLRKLPLPDEAFATLFPKAGVCHFFLQVPQGWMEIRGGTIHPTIDQVRESKPQGYLFAGRIWIDDSIRRMSQFSGFDLQILPFDAAAPEPSHEESGLITFTRELPGWDGKPAAKIAVKNDSPIIRELNRASERLFNFLLVFAALLFLVLAVSLLVWVRQPLHRLTAGLRTGNPATLEPLRKAPNEFGQLAELILQFRRTEEALSDAEERLRHAQKLEAVGRLAGGIAHDFNNLLTAIIGYAELLEDRHRTDKHELRVCATDPADGREGGKPHETVARIQPAPIAHAGRSWTWNAMIQELEKLLQRVIGEHIRIEIHARATDARVRADPGQLEQVILNLGVKRPRCHAPGRCAHHLHRERRHAR